MQGGGEGDTAWVIFFVNDNISVEFEWREDDASCIALRMSLADSVSPDKGGEKN